MGQIFKKDGSCGIIHLAQPVAHWKHKQLRQHALRSVSLSNHSLLAPHKGYSDLALDVIEGSLLEGWDGGRGGGLLYMMDVAGRPLVDQTVTATAKLWYSNIRPQKSCKMPCLNFSHSPQGGFIQIHPNSNVPHFVILPRVTRTRSSEFLQEGSGILPEKGVLVTKMWYPAVSGGP